MTVSNLDFYKNKLKEELSRLERELSAVARRDPENPEAWKTISPELNPQSADPNELADKFEEFDTQFGIGAALDERLRNVKKALERIEDGVYGKCATCDKPIDEKRLNANVAAITCIEHAE